MLLLAMSFASAPLLRGARHSSKGYVNIQMLGVLTALLLAIGLYAAIGRPDIATGASVDALPNNTAQRSHESDAKRAASVNALLAGLEQRLEEDPQDAKRWLLLAKSYDHLGRTADAAAAYEKASELGISDDALEARLK